MKRIILTTLLVGLFVAPAMAQRKGMDRGQMRAMDDRKNQAIERTIEIYLIIVDYNSWFEKLTATSSTGGVQESDALFYGFGIGVEKNWYRPKWGYGISATYLTGSAVGGDAAGDLTYFKARVPWSAFRVNPRIFFRWTPRTDFGLDLSAFFKQGKWPVANGDVTAVSGSDTIAGAFLDMRLRFNPKLEMIQAVGMIYKDASIYWRLGLAYRL